VSSSAGDHLAGQLALQTLLALEEVLDQLKLALQRIQDRIIAPA
jgi:hypothetical protein